MLASPFFGDHMEFNKLSQKRTCIRAYKDTPVTKEQLDYLLHAATMAPNACNFQSWHFYAVTNKEKIRAIHPDIARIPWIEDISCLIVVAIDENIRRRLNAKFGPQGDIFVHQDAAGAVNHILLAAADIGLGGCWVGPMKTEQCKAHFSMAEHHTPLAIVTLGTPKEDTPKRERKPLSDAVTYIA